VTLFAAGGLFFNEWYWEPILRALHAVPVLAVVAFVVDLAVRRWVRPLAGPLRGGLVTGIVLGGATLILAGGLFVASGEHARESRAVARTIAFATYEPRSLPPRFVLDRSTAAVGRDAPAIHVFYLLTPSGFASVTQERPPGERNTRYSGDCLLAGASGTCREVRSRKGIRVMLATTVAHSLEASALLDGTLVSVSAYNLNESEMLAYFDALRPVAPDELEFKRG